MSCCTFQNNLVDRKQNRALYPSINYSKKSFEVLTYLLVFQIGHKTSNIDSIMNKNDLTDILDILHGETVFFLHDRGQFSLNCRRESLKSVKENIKFHFL